MALCNHGHGSARRHRDLTAARRAFRIPERLAIAGNAGRMCDRTPTGLENAACREGSRPSKGNTRSKRDWGCGAGAGRDAGPDKSRAGDRLLSTTPLPRTSHAETTPLDCGRNPGPDLLGLPHRALLTRRGPIKVGVWRGGVRLGISVPAPFVWRCLSGSAVAPFPHPPHR